MGKKLHWKLKSSRKKNREMRVSTEGGIYLKKDVFDKTLQNTGFEFKPVSEALEEGLAYEQTEMVKDAVSRIEHYAN